MSNRPLHSVSVAGVVVDKGGRVLVIRRRDNGEWQIPGGILETGETFEECVEREVGEEANIRVKAERLTGVYKNMTLGVVALVYRCGYLSGEAVPSEEAVEVAWLHFDRATEIMKPAFAIRVTDALRDESYPASRAHDGYDLLVQSAADK